MKRTAILAVLRQRQAISGNSLREVVLPEPIASTGQIVAGCPRGEKVIGLAAEERTAAIPSGVGRSHHDILLLGEEPSGNVEPSGVAPHLDRRLRHDLVRGETRDTTAQGRVMPVAGPVLPALHHPVHIGGDAYGGIKVAGKA